MQSQESGHFSHSRGTYQKSWLFLGLFCRKIIDDALSMAKLCGAEEKEDDYV
jgi:hypothetical protein